jgi:hypothetical protein
MRHFFSLSPFPERTFTRAPRRLFGEVTATDAASIVVSLIAECADLKAVLEFRRLDFLQAVGHMSGQ